MKTSMFVGGWEGRESAKLADCTENENRAECVLLGLPDWENVKVARL